MDTSRVDRDSSSSSRSSGSSSSSSNSGSMIGSSSYVMCMIAFLCFTSVWPAETHARPLVRAQRQVLAGELATGLTGTGLSFNPLYAGQNVVDSYYGYQPQQQQQAISQLGDIAPPAYNYASKNLPLGGAGVVYSGYQGAYGTKGTSGTKGIVGTQGGYGSGLGLSGIKSSKGNSFNGGWQGFGTGKSPAYGGRPASQHGLKY